MTAADAERRAARLIAAAAQAPATSASDGAPMAVSTLLLAGDLGLALVDALLDARQASPSGPRQVVAVLSQGQSAHWPSLRARLAGLDTGRPSHRWPEWLVPGLEPLPVLPDGLALTLAIGEPGTMLRGLTGSFDRLVLSDAAPIATSVVGRWHAGVLTRLAAPGARLIVGQTTADPTLAPALRRAGFAIGHDDPAVDGEVRIATRVAPRAAGRATMSSAAATTSGLAASTAATEPSPSITVPVAAARQALIVGAGLAGAAIAAALSERGWSVTVLERHDGPAREGSGQPRIVDHLHVSADDNPMARLTRAGARLAAVRDWVGEVARPVGKLLVPADTAECDAQAAMLARLALPPDWARLVGAHEALALSGLRTPAGGLWLAKARVADPVRQCADWLSRPGITVRVAAAVGALVHRDGLWCALAEPSVGGPTDAVVLACAPVAIVAAATATPALAGSPSLVLERLAGQTTMLAGGPLATLRSALGGAAYACPLGDGRVLIGSTFSDAADFAPDAAGDADNVARIARALGLPGDALTPFVASRHGGVRCATRDRLPAIGAMPDEPAIAVRAAELGANDRLPLPRQPGLYGACGLGARGLLWSVLAAEVIAAQLAGEPPPLTTDLLDAIDPARFARAALRRGRYPA